jgi:hypothetical protein
VRPALDVQFIIVSVDGSESHEFGISGGQMN